WITDGAALLRSVTRSGESTLPAFEVQTVNTTGAGDAFVGGMLSWLVREEVSATNLSAFLKDDARVKTALRFAAACGALAVTRHGAFEAMPSLPEVEKFLREHA
ncbi:MAG: PfkB family carbohydrate kinase, partial [Gammaproteobacteria bacterium]